MTSLGRLQINQTAGATFTATGGGQPASVPEIDTSGMGSVVALITGVLGLVERRRRVAA